MLRENLKKERNSTGSPADTTTRSGAARSPVPLPHLIGTQVVLHPAAQKRKRGTRLPAPPRRGGTAHGHAHTGSSSVLPILPENFWDQNLKPSVWAICQWPLGSSCFMFFSPGLFGGSPGSRGIEQSF